MFSKDEDAFDIQREPNTVWQNYIQSNAAAFFANGSNKRER